MDGINIFKSQNPFIISTPEEPAETSPSQEGVAPTSILGIANTADLLEDASSKSSDYLPFLSQQFVAPATSPIPYAKEETVDASNLFDYFSLPPAAMIPKVDGESLKSGQISWETIEFLKSELTNKNPDSSAMMDKLLQLKPADLAVTLIKMAESGTPSDVSRIVSWTCSDPESMKKMGTLLTNVASNLPATKLQPVLTEMFDRVTHYSGSQHVFMDFIEEAKEKDILPYLNGKCVNLMHLYLLNDGSIEGSLCGIALGKENSHKPTMPDGVVWGIPDPSTMITPFLEGDRNDLSVADALAHFPEWGMKEINKMAADPYNSQLPRLITRMLETGQELGPFLAQFCKQPGSAGALGAIFFELKNGGMIRNTQSQYPISMSSVADDQIRRMVEEMGDEAIAILSKLEPVQLLDIKAILQGGNDSTENQLVIQNIIDPSYNAAKQD